MACGRFPLITVISNKKIVMYENLPLEQQLEKLREEAAQAEITLKTQHLQINKMIVQLLERNFEVFVGDCFYPYVQSVEEREEADSNDWAGCKILGLTYRGIAKSVKDALVTVQIVRVNTVTTAYSVRTEKWPLTELFEVDSNNIGLSKSNLFDYMSPGAYDRKVRLVHKIIQNIVDETPEQLSS
jgi:hypothetical protein